MTYLEQLNQEAIELGYIGSEMDEITAINWIAENTKSYSELNKLRGWLYKDGYNYVIEPKPEQFIAFIDDERSNVDLSISPANPDKLVINVDSGSGITEDRVREIACEEATIISNECKEDMLLNEIPSIIDNRAEHLINEKVMPLIEGKVDINEVYMKDEVYNTGECYNKSEVNYLISSSGGSGGSTVYTSNIKSTGSSDFSSKYLSFSENTYGTSEGFLFAGLGGTNELPNNILIYPKGLTNKDNAHIDCELSYNIQWYGSSTGSYPRYCNIIMNATLELYCRVNQEVIKVADLDSISEKIDNYMFQSDNYNYKNFSHSFKHTFEYKLPKDVPEMLVNSLKSAILFKVKTSMDIEYINNTGGAGTYRFGYCRIANDGRLLDLNLSINTVKWEKLDDDVVSPGDTTKILANDIYLVSNTKTHFSVKDQIQTKADIVDVYTKEEVDNIISSIPPSSGGGSGGSDSVTTYHDIKDKMIGINLIRYALMKKTRYESAGITEYEILISARDEAGSATATTLRSAYFNYTNDFEGKQLSLYHLVSTSMHHLSGSTTVMNTGLVKVGGTSTLIVHVPFSSTHVGSGSNVDFGISIRFVVPD
ncbi:MAG: hypothetical protein ACRCXT_05010 [Paraclostridium sp.]